MNLRIIVLLVLQVFTATPLIANNPFVAKKGILDLSNYRYGNGPAIKLNGEWFFVWNKFKSDVVHDSATQFVNVPNPWNVYRGELFFANQSGFCTYQLKVVLPVEGKLWSIRLPPIHSAYKLYIDEELITQVGTPATDNTMNPEVRTQIIHFIPKRKEMVLTLQVSNFYFVSGGVLAPMLLGAPPAIESEREKSFFLSAFLMGSLLIMGLYHLALYLLWSKDKGFLFFCIICVLLALRESFGGEAMFYSAFPLINYELSIKILYLIFPIALVAFTMFFKSLYPSFSKLIEYLVLALSAPFLLLVLITPNTLYGRFLPVLSLVFLIETIYLIILVGKKTITQPKENGLVLAGIVLLILTFFNDLLYDAGVINSVFLLPFGFFLFTLLQSVMLSIRFINALKQSNILSIELIKRNRDYEEMQYSLKQEILKSQLEIQEQTFQTISEEIHDNVGQKLIWVKVNMDAVDLELPPGGKEKLNHASTILTQAIQELRDLSKTLNTDFIDEIGLAKAIEQQLALLNKTGTYKCNFKVNGDLRPIESHRELVSFRIIQELLNNVVKHADATEISVEMNYLPEKLTIQVSDNGKGFNVNDNRFSQSGIGLRNIYSRTNLIKGNVSFESHQKGTTVTLELLRDPDNEELSE